MSGGDGQLRKDRRFFTVPAGSKPIACRGKTCTKFIYFITNPATNRPHPIDCDVDGGELPTAHRDKSQASMFDVDEPPHEGRGVSHFSTCPDAVQFRRGDH